MEDPTVQQWTYGNYSPFVDCTSDNQDDVKATRSGPDTKLTELEQQLEVAETRCGSLKSQLDYMKMLYQGVQPCSPESIESAEEEDGEEEEEEEESPQPTEEQPKIAAEFESSQNGQPEFIEKKENCEENSASEDVKYYQFLEKIQKMHERVKEDVEEVSSRKSSRSLNTSPRVVEEHSATPEQECESISAEYRHVKKIRKTYTLLGSAAENLAASEPSSLPTAPTSLQMPEICKERDIDDATAMHLTEYSTCLEKNLAIASNLISQSVPENKYEREDENEPLQRDKKRIKKHDLVLKLTESVDSAPTTVKRKKIVKHDKKQRPGSSLSSGAKKSTNFKYDDSLSVTSKSKRKKAKLRNATSKNVVMTRETNFSDRRESKKRKQKGYSSSTRVSHQLQAPVNNGPAHTRAEIVEIYHNNAVEGGSGSVSVSSSKQLKQEIQQLSNNLLPKKGSPAEISLNEKFQVQLTQQQQQQKQQIFSNGQKVLQERNEARTPARINNHGLQKGSARSRKSQNNNAIQDSLEETARCSSAQHPSEFYDPTITRNYELPTVASKLKKVNRSYFNRFNFRNIPFVVSTSVTPSHNLGLNIQQVLSIMKTRQPMATGIAPLLIRKMSKGIKPVSTLLDRINDPYCIKSPRSSLLDRQSETISCGRPKTTAECAVSADKSINKSKYTSHEQVSAQEYSNFGETKLQDCLLEEDEEQESGCVCCPKKSKSYNKMLKQYTSRKSISGNPTLTSSALLKERQEEISIGDNQYNKIKNGSGNAKGIREVLINLHDQFEELNSTYEKLQEKAAKTDDVSISKQIAAIEKELNAKEDEINAVVGLYKEVLQLKQQVNSIHGKNSFVCITTSNNNNNNSSPLMIPRSGVTRAQVINHMDIFGMRNRGQTSSIREPATATRLAGLLREIQSFQKQLLAL